MAGDHIGNEIAKMFVAWARGSEFASEIESEVWHYYGAGAEEAANLLVVLGSEV